MYLKMLVHAPSGHGKTRFIGTATQDARFMPGLLCDFEGGYTTIRSRVETVELRELAHLKDPSTSRLTHVRIKAWRDIDDIYEVLTSDDCPFRFVAFDSLSEIHYLSLAEVVYASYKRAPAQHDPDLANQQDFGKALAQMRKFIRYFRDLDGMHVLFTATTMDTEDARTRRGQARPNLIGKLSSEAPALVDFVGYLGIRDIEGGGTMRVLCTGPSERYIAKARNDEDTQQQLPEFLDNPTLPAVLSALYGETAQGNSRP